MGRSCKGAHAPAAHVPAQSEREPYLTTQLLTPMRDFHDRLNSEEAYLLEQVLTRSATDPEFRQRLLTNPAAALQEDLGFTPPSDYVVRFVEKPADVDEIVVLPDPIDASVELNEEELEAVAGGVAEQDISVCWTTCNGSSCEQTADVTSQN